MLGIYLIRDSKVSDFIFISLIFFDFVCFLKLNLKFEIVIMFVMTRILVLVQKEFEDTKG